MGGTSGRGGRSGIGLAIGKSFVRCSVFVAGLVGLCVGGERSVEEGRRRGVDGSSEEHEAVGEDVGSETEDGVPINARVLKVDSRRAIGCDDNLELQDGN